MGESAVGVLHLKRCAFFPLTPPPHVVIEPWFQSYVRCASGTLRVWRSAPSPLTPLSRCATWWHFVR